MKTKLLSSVLSVARREWGLIRENPISDVRKLTQPPARDRLQTPDEPERLALSAGDDLGNMTARAFHAFLFAIESAMRASEICRLEWADLNIDRCVARLHHTKNGTSRDVPLSPEAIRLLQALPKIELAFGPRSASLDVLWRKIRDRAGVAGLNFHDSRHAAITPLAGRLNVLVLARMVGHWDLRQLQSYDNESAEQLAKRLA